MKRWVSARDYIKQERCDLECARAHARGSGRGANGGVGCGCVRTVCVGGGVRGTGWKGGG